LLDFLLKNSWWMPGIFFEQADDGGGGGEESTESTEATETEGVLGAGGDNDGGNDDSGDDSGDSDADNTSTHSDPFADSSSEESSEEGGEEGVTPAAWQAQAKGENKTRKDLAEFPTINDLIEAYDNLRESTASAAPEDPSEYGLSDEVQAKRFQELGLSKEAATEVSKEIETRVKEAQKDFFGKYGGNKDTAEKWIRETFGKEHVDKKNDMLRALNLADADFNELITKTPIGNNPTVLKYLQYVGSLFGEDNVPLPSNEGGVIDEDEAKMRRMYPSMY